MVGADAEADMDVDVEVNGGVLESESSSLLRPGRRVGRVSEQQVKIAKAVLYAVQVFYSFFIM